MKSISSRSKEKWNRRKYWNDQDTSQWFAIALEVFKSAIAEFKFTVADLKSDKYYFKAGNNQLKAVETAKIKANENAN